jgi:benzylsuccinate CoA-transferase BbsF subunit
MTLDMKHPKALGLVSRLIAQSDVVANNFTPGVMDRFGLSYDAVRAIKPDIIYLSMSMNGSAGPESRYLGYGASMASITGLQHLTGVPGRTPAGTGTNYPDHVPNPCHAAFAVLAALRHRRRTGEGQRIDMAQTEPTISLMGPAVLDYTVNGRVQQPRANEHALAAPHGVYPCKGDDRWIAICVMSDEQWNALRQTLDDPQWMQDNRFSRAQGRLRCRDEIDIRLNDETARWAAESLMAVLQSRGVAAGVVETAEDLTRDPQLVHRGHWVKLEHAEMGQTLYNAPPFRCERMTVALSRPAPLLGEHTEEICRELLGLSPAEVQALNEEGVLI